MKNETMYFNDLLSIWLEKQKQARARSTYANIPASGRPLYLPLFYIHPAFKDRSAYASDLPQFPFIPGFPASAWERNYPLYSSARQLHSASFL